ncbi:MAG: hypothetical protein IT379_23485, partial [Deltaproteobacteria bacterium]|nr:hypothetical protein [Deltaproteobacteria bacterium]
MRRLLRATPALLLSLALAACGDDDGPASMPDAGVPDAPTPPPPPDDSGTGDDGTTDDGGALPPEGCVSLRGAGALLSGFARQTGAASVVSMIPDVAADAVALAPVQAFGALEESTPLPHGAHDSAGWYHDGWLYTLGGQDDGPVNLDTLWAAPLDATGTLGAWQAGTAFPILILDHSVRMHGGRAYLTGGGQCNASGICRQQTASYVADPRDGDVGAWLAQTENPHRRMGHDAVIAAGFLYTIGGDDGDVSTDDVSFAPILPDGSLGPWRMTTPTPEGGLQFLAAAATSRHVYIVGGCRRKDCFRTTNIEDRVFVADVAADGALGEWRVAAMLPVRTFDPAVMVHGGRLVVSGGRPGGFGRCGDFGGDESDEVWFADVMPDGSLGPWTGGAAEGSVMPRPRSDHNILVVWHEPFDATGDVWMWGGRTSCVEGEDRSWDLEYPPSVWRAPLVNA